MTLAWLRTKVSQRCFGSGVRTGPSLRRNLPTVRGETRMLSLSFSSLAMRSSPQLGFSAAISRMSLRKSLYANSLIGSVYIHRAHSGEAYDDTVVAECTAAHIEAATTNRHQQIVRASEIDSSK